MRSTGQHHPERVPIPRYALKLLVRAAIEHGAGDEVAGAIAHLQLCERQADARRSGIGTTPCDDCGDPHGESSGSYWTTDAPLWGEVVGRNDVVLCIACFTARAHEQGISLHWRPVIDRRADATGRGE